MKHSNTKRGETQDNKLYLDTSRAFTRGLIPFYGRVLDVEEPLNKSETPVSEEAQEIPLRFVIPPGMTSRYAHHMLVQSGENEVTLSFFEVILPLIVGTPDEQREIVKQGVKAECVARIVIARSRYPDFVKAMTVHKESKL